MHNFNRLPKIMANSENSELVRRSIWENLGQNSYVPIAMENKVQFTLT